MLSPSSA
ncbi:hypothetical protein F383_37913 [Gossypium arboreum]|nr:hypothetical protein F383_37913 [Gossypium arboreum]